MIKRLTSAGANWQVPSTSLEPNFDWVLKLDTADAYADNSGFFADTAPDAVNITLGDDSGTNTGHDYIAYVFASKKGFSKVGGYYGSGNTNGPFVYTGFRPAFLMIKQTAGANDWVLYDSARMPINGDGVLLKPNTTAVEATNSTWTTLDLLSNGFKPRGTDGVSNGTDLQYLYIAFAEFPIVSSNSKAGTAR